MARPYPLPVLLWLALLFSLPGIVCGRIWSVPSECPTIKAGLDSAVGGDTVLVAPGTYGTSDDPETWIWPGEGDCLCGECGADVTVIEMCNTSAGIVLCPGAEGARIKGFTIRFGNGPGCVPPMSPTYGIVCWDVTDVVVEACVIEGLNVGIQIEGTSHEWYKPAFKNMVIRTCGYGVMCHEMYDPGRPYFQGNEITDCCCGADVVNSSPLFDGNEITYCLDYGMRYFGRCGGDCWSNTIAHNRGCAVAVWSNPPAAAPGFNGGWNPAEANDFDDNGSWDIWFEHTTSDALVMAILNYWGTRCPSFAGKIYGRVTHVPWTDSTHTLVLNESNCPDAALPTTWGAIKALFR